MNGAGAASSPMELHVRRTREQKPNGKFARRRHHAAIDLPIFVLRGARTVARISHVPQIGSQTAGKKAAALIFAHASGMVMVNAIAKGAGIKGAQPRLAGERRRA
jgi:hypothetical protein